MSSGRREESSLEMRRAGATNARGLTERCDRRARPAGRARRAAKDILEVNTSSGRAEQRARRQEVMQKYTSRLGTIEIVDGLPRCLWSLVETPSTSGKSDWKSYKSGLENSKPVVQRMASSMAGHAEMLGCSRRPTDRGTQGRYACKEYGSTPSRASSLPLASRTPLKHLLVAVYLIYLFISYSRCSLTG